MTDYGHDLRFGTFLTPTNDPPQRVVEMAVLSERVGLDLVTFQDHPYVANFHDTWTLLSFVAARTSRVRLAPNVANVALRLPAMLARSVASLDLLSGGRVELGLGAGAFWEGITAMGGRPLAPGERITALEETIEILRQTWDADVRGGVKVEGAIHQVVGAKRGAPAHDVELWIGAYKPRMLRLTGRLGDGWLPTTSYLQPGDLQRGNLAIDQAAAGAGRRPADVRRLLNISGEFRATSAGALQGPVEQWVDELAELALADGISTFILGSDDPQTIQRFAGEVAPAVRDAVDAERQRPSTSEPTLATHSSAANPVVDARPATTSGTPTGTGHGQHLVDVHNGLRAELEQVYALLDEVAKGTRDVSSARSHINLMTMRQNNWTLGTYCESYCRIVTTHHSLEDAAMLPHLRAVEPALGPVIDRLKAEHHSIHDLLENVDAALVRLVSEPDAMAHLRSAVDEMAEALLAHLAYEEEQLVEPLDRHGMWPGQL